MVARTTAPASSALPQDDIGLLLLDACGYVQAANESLTALTAETTLWNEPAARVLAALEACSGPEHSWASYPLPLRSRDGAVSTALLLLPPDRQITQAALEAMERELQVILACCFDEVHVTDGHGTTLHISTRSDDFFGVPPERLIGLPLEELERLSLARPLVTRLVLDKQRRVTTLQETVTGRRLLVTGYPVFDASGVLARIVITSTDVTNVDRLVSALEEARGMVLAYQRELDQLRGPRGERPLIYRGAAMERLIETARRVAEIDCPVLIQGEAGAGKEVLARAIHRWSPRADKPLVTVDCGAIPESLLAAELFGQEADIATARRERKSGLIAAANGGALFLDAVSELPPALQAKLLRAIEEQAITPVGGRTPVAVDFRVIASANRDLQELTRGGQFRQDLFYRLSVAPLQVPPLRERPEDVLPLADHFLDEFGQRYKRQKRLSPAAVDALVSYDWPGNVRELANLMERLAVTVDEAVIVLDHLPAPISRNVADRPAIEINRLLPLKDALAAVEAQLLQEALRQGGSSHKAAALLGVNQSTVVRKLQRLRQTNGPTPS